MQSKKKIIKFIDLGPGLALSFTLALLAAYLGGYFPLVGGAVFGILFGLIINSFWQLDSRYRPGFSFASKTILKLSIILLGSGLSLSYVFLIGSESFLVMFVSLLAAYLAAYVFGKILKLDWQTISLIGTGTAVCGASAIAAISPVIKADQEKIATAITTIFAFNLLAVLIFPSLGSWMNLSDQGFGMWAGTAINDTSSVVAAGYIYSQTAGDFATIVKLVRSIMIIPIALVFMGLVTYREQREGRLDKAKSGQAKSKVLSIFPWFILGFLAMSLLNSLALIPDSLQELSIFLAKFMIVWALTAIGLSARLGQLFRAGFRPLLLGLLTWFVLALTSLLVQYLTGWI